MQGIISTTGAPSRSFKTFVLLAIGVTLLVGVNLWYTKPEMSGWKLPRPFTKGNSDSGAYAASDARNHEQQLFQDEDDDLPCRKLLGGRDVVVVMRTGATEIQDKLPIHLNTTFRCYSDLIILSDYEEEFGGYHVHDLLAGVDDKVKQEHPDFALYQHLQAHGRDSLNASELSGKVSYDSGPIGKIDNAGWRLDKWKFLPMAVRTLELRPEKKWYVFVEPDTYLVWSNLLDWLKRLDHTEASYYGSEVQIGDDVFAHGGSAFVVSNPALKQVAETYESDMGAWHEKIAKHWAGDCIFGQALFTQGTPLTWAWPMFQGGNPATMDYKEDKMDGRRLWCSPALSYHHLSPSEIENFWHFEQSWIRKTLPRIAAEKPVSFRQRERLRLHHSDVYRHYVLPNVGAVRSNWTNASGELRAGTSESTIEDCRIMCEADERCVQYMLSDVGCSAETKGFMGRAEEGVQAGWLEDRMIAWADGHEVCGRAARWTVP